jgi:hypothetical protein
MPSAQTRDWTDTALWKALDSRASSLANSDAAEFHPILTLWMRHLEKVLRSGTSPHDFTLHDAGHSFRVPERIWQLVSPKIQKNLSDYEIALLLLAAYGHDIGMTPERDKALSHHRHLFGHPTGLSAEEKQTYQTFLRLQAGPSVIWRSGLAEPSLASQGIFPPRRPEHFHLLWRR